MAATLDDVLERRTGVQFFSWETAMRAAPVAAAVMQKEMGWDSAHAQREVDDYVQHNFRLGPENWCGESRGEGVEPSSWAEFQLRTKDSEMADYIGAIDQGTTSTRFMCSAAAGGSCHGAERTPQIYPQPGWVEHDPAEIWARTRDVMPRRIASQGCGARPRCHGHHQSARDHGGLEPQTGKPVVQRNRVAGHARRRTTCGNGCRSRRAGPISRARPGCPWPLTSAG